MPAVENVQLQASVDQVELQLCDAAAVRCSRGSKQLLPALTRLTSHGSTSSLTLLHSSRRFRTLRALHLNTLIRPLQLPLLDFAADTRRRSRHSPALFVCDTPPLSLSLRSSC